MPKNVIITPATGLVEFKGNSGNTDATIQLDDSGNLNLTSPNGDISIGDTTSDIFIGDGVNSVDIIFEQNGDIRALDGKTLTLGQANSNISIASPITSKVTIANTTPSSSFDTGALVVNGGIGASGNVYIKGASSVWAVVANSNNYQLSMSLNDSLGSLAVGWGTSGSPSAFMSMTASGGKNQIFSNSRDFRINTAIGDAFYINASTNNSVVIPTNVPAVNTTSGSLIVAGGAGVSGNLYAGNVVSLGGITVEGSLDAGSGDYAGWRANGTNIILKGNDVGRSGIFFQSERNGTNINHPTDFGYIQFHPMGIDGSTGESNKLVIGVANDADDFLVLQSPYKNGVKISYKDTTSGTGGTEYTVWHAGNHGVGSGLDADLLDGLNGTSYANAAFAQGGFTQANSAILSAQGAFEKGNTALIVGQNAYNLSNTSSQLAFSNITVNGVTLSANNKQTNLQLTSGNGVTLSSNAVATSINVQLTSTGVTAGTYGSANSVPVITIDTQGRITFANAVSMGSSSGASAGYPRSSLTTIYGTLSSKDLRTGPDNVTAETPFDQAVDAFGVIVAPVYDCMDPVGSYVTFDLNT